MTHANNMPATNPDVYTMACSWKRCFFFAQYGGRQIGRQVLITHVDQRPLQLLTTIRVCLLISATLHRFS